MCNNGIYFVFLPFLYDLLSPAPKCYILPPLGPLSQSAAVHLLFLTIFSNLYISTGSPQPHLGLLRSMYLVLDKIKEEPRLEDSSLLILYII